MYVCAAKVDLKKWIKANGEENRQENIILLRDGYECNCFLEKQPSMDVKKNNRMEAWRGKPPYLIHGGKGCLYVKEKDTKTLQRATNSCL